MDAEPGARPVADVSLRAAIAGRVSEVHADGKRGAMMRAARRGGGTRLGQRNQGPRNDRQHAS